MCRIVTVGVAGASGDPHAPFRAAGFTTRPATNPASAAMPAKSVRIEVTTGMCSCDFYSGDTPYQAFDPEAARRRYERKGWSKTKIERAIESRHKPRNPGAKPLDLGARFVDAIAQLTRSGARVHLLAHEFDGAFDEPFEIAGTTELPLDYYLKHGNYFPEDTVVTLRA
jgi:hypothetical protein